MNEGRWGSRAWGLRKYGPNLIKPEDYQFNQGANDWHLYGGNLHAEVTHLGRECYRLTYVNNAQGAYMYVKDQADGCVTSDLVNGTNYIIRGKACVNNGSVGLSIFQYLVNGTAHLTVKAAINETVWTDFSVEAICSHAAVNMTMRFGNMGGTEIVYLTDLEIRKVLS